MTRDEVLSARRNPASQGRHNRTPRVKLWEKAETRAILHTDPFMVGREAFDDGMTLLENWCRKDEARELWAMGWMDRRDEVEEEKRIEAARGKLRITG